MDFKLNDEQKQIVALVDELGKKELRQLIRKMLYDREMYKWFRLNRIILD